MPDYKELYLKMFRATEQAAAILIAVQQESEELYISSSEPESTAVSSPTENKRMDSE